MSDESSRDGVDKEEHKRLASFVKGVHADLRKKLKANRGDYQKIWDDHCQNKEVLSEYADAMQHLAIDYWSRIPQTRIDWCRNNLTEYFFDGGLKLALEKEEKKRKRQEERAKQCAFPNMEESHKSSLGSGPEPAATPQVPCATSEERFPCNYGKICLPFQGKIRLLDVGSCYNPFLQFKEFLTVGIDISPAKQSGVYYCDFLHLETSDPLQVASDTLDTYVNSLKDPIEKLPRELFHSVVFSLFLEYFPSPYQRWLCCQKAHNLLMVNGLLVIITPDSHAQHRNAPMLKSWRLAIESMGFCRWRYMKLDHIHCMAFRKIIKPESDNCLVGDVTPDMMYIPQDFNDTSHEESILSHYSPFTAEDEDFFRATLQELPAVSMEDDVEDSL